MTDILLAKGAIVERCMRRIDEEYAGDPDRLRNFTHQDAIVLNIERACQAAIDMAMHVVAQEHLGIPQSSGEAFTLLEAAGRINANLAGALRAMVGFRNVAVHSYQALSVDILKQVIEGSRQDLTAFCQALGIDIA